MGAQIATVRFGLSAKIRPSTSAKSERIIWVSNLVRSAIMTLTALRPDWYARSPNPIFISKSLFRL
jgi:hypothetical protein